MYKRAFREQRRDARKPIDIVLNKYIEGEPHLCCAVNISRFIQLRRDALHRR